MSKRWAAAAHQAYVGIGAGVPGIEIRTQTPNGKEGFVAMPFRSACVRVRIRVRVLVLVALSACQSSPVTAVAANKGATNILCRSRNQFLPINCEKRKR